MNHKLQHTLACLLALTLLICPVLAVSPFSDVPDGAPYADAAEYLNDVGIMQGDAQGNFNPGRNVTRAQMAALLCRMLGEAENLATDGTRFTDVPADYWANGYIMKAASLGIISGYKVGTFRPDNTVTYSQAVTMVVRAVGMEEIALEYGGYPDGYIKIAEESGFLAHISAAKGDPLSRANTALLIFNYFNNNV